MSLILNPARTPPPQVYHPENLEEALNAATRDFCSKFVDVVGGPVQVERC
jgi:hypothetical protein